MLDFTITVARAVYLLIAALLALQVLSHAVELLTWATEFFRCRVVQIRAEIVAQRDR